MQRFILTGAPGCGKTTVLRALATRGHAVIAEAATDLIEREAARGVVDVWARGDFIDQITALQRDRQIGAASSDVSVQFFDRSPICTHALSVFLGYPISAALEAELARVEAEQIYQRRVLFFDNLGFIEPTVARTISFKDAVAFERVHEQSYQTFGYEILRVSAGPVAHRLRAALSLTLGDRSEQAPTQSAE